MPKLRSLLLLSGVSLAAAACTHKGDLEINNGVGVDVVRSSCPRVEVAAGTGDVTLFDPANARTADAIDVAAVLTDVRSTCDDASGAAQIGTAITFRVDARRRDTAAARDVTLPFFVTVVQGNTQVVSKRNATVTLHFDAGQARASATGRGGATIDRAAATLPEDVRRRLTERRKAGTEDAAVDPLSRPEVARAVSRATFEALVGFQLTDDQLKYNAQR